jgi:hypothetical protein
VSGRFAPHRANALAQLLEPGALVVFRGEALVTQHGTVVDIRELGSSREDMPRLGQKAGKPKRRDADAA